MQNLVREMFYRIYNQTKRPELICYDHLRNEVVSPSDAKRKISYLSVEQPPAITSSNISYQNSYGNVEEEIEGLCESYNFGLTRNSYLEWAYWFNIKRPSWNKYSF